MKLRFYGADRCVTGSCHCLEVNGKHILVDCGLQQGRDEIDNTALHDYFRYRIYETTIPLRNALWNQS